MKFKIFTNLQGLKDLGGLYLILTVLFSSTMFAQEVKIQVSNAKMDAELYQLEGEKAKKIDPVFSKNGNYQFSLKGKHNGFYRLQFDKKHFIDFINDGKDIELKTNYNNLIDSLMVVKSESNKLYYEFLKLNEDYKTKTELLQLILTRYPNDDDYFTTTKEKLSEIQKEYMEFVNIKSQDYPNSFIARYIKSSQLPVIDGSIPVEKQLDYLKKHSLDNVDFDDSEMIYSDLFTNKSIEYLSYYRNPNLPKPLLEKAFITAVDIILNKAKVNELVYKQITQYLIDGFTQFGFDNIIDYIIKNYVLADDLCLDEGTGNSIQNRVNQAKLLKVGESVPNIILPDNSGNSIDLSKITSENTLLLFYASWCPHCQKIIPKIKELYNNTKRKNFEVLAISLDTNKDDWLNFIKENNLNWLNVSDVKGWDSEVAKSYYIYATPTMFLLDKKERIIAKPLNVKELKAAIRNDK